MQKVVEEPCPEAWALDKKSQQVTVNSTVVNATVQAPKVAADEPVAASSAKPKEVVSKDATPSDAEAYFGVKRSQNKVAADEPVAASSAKPQVVADEPVAASSAKAKEAVSKDATPSDAEAYFGVKKSQKRTRSMEGHLISSLEKADPEAVPCLTHCRYGEETRHHWTECLERCVENIFMRQTFFQMLPDEHHAEKDLDHAIPHGLELPTPEELTRVKHLVQRRERSSEL